MLFMSFSKVIDCLSFTPGAVKVDFGSISGKSEERASLSFNPVTAEVASLPSKSLLLRSAD